MGENALRRLALALAATVAATVPITASAAAQTSPVPGVPLPDVSNTPVVGEVVDTVEAQTGVDLPVDQEAPAPSPTPAPATPETPPAPSGGSSGSAGGEPAAPAPSPSPSAAPGSSQTSSAGDSGQPSAPAPASSSNSEAGGEGGAASSERRSGQRADRDADSGERSSGDDSKSALSAFVDDFVGLPWAVFASIAALALIGLAMAARSGVLASRGRRLHAQSSGLREDVGALQAALLPEIPERIGPLEVSVAYRPSDGPAAGGDFHDVVELSGGRVGIVVGDVSGHGREALTVTALAHYTVRAYLEAGLEPREALRLAEDALGDKLGENFVTVLAAVYDPALSVLRYATAGHPAPILLGATAPEPAEELTPPPIGIGPRTGYRQTELSIPADARLLIFTDGLVEARTAPAELLDREGLEAIARELDPESSAAELLDRLTDRAELSDDATACLLRPVGAQGNPGIRDELDLEALAGLERKLEDFLVASGVAAEQAELALATVAERESQGLRLAVARRDGAARWELVDDDSAPSPAARRDGATRLASA